MLSYSISESNWNSRKANMFPRCQRTTSSRDKNELR
jgi:hypothetical protein